MIPRLRPYAEMMDSGVPWLTMVPRHWEVRRLRNVVEMRVSTIDKHSKDGEQPVRLCNYVDVYKNDRIHNKMKFMRATAATEEVERFRLRVGDVLITKDSETWNDIGVPALVLEAADDLVSGYHLAILRPLSARLDGGYLFRVLQSTGVAYQFHVEANGVTRYGLSHSAIKSVCVPVPPADDQAAIVRFLDHADRRIQRYILAKKKLIALLEAQKQAIIHRVVTRGLDLSVPLKSSGVEWLGDVPEHWEVWQIGHFCQVGNGSTPSRSTSAYWSGGKCPWLNSSSVNAGTILASDQFVTDTALKECHLPRVPSGSVLVAITGQGKTRGTAAILGIDATISQHIAFIAPHKRKRATPTFLKALLVAAYSELRRMSDDSGSTKGALTCEALRHFRTPLPPVEEQERIVRWVQNTTAEADAARRLASREIELLREYRTRLIADVVTGKLDVREAAAKLPDEAVGEDALESDADEAGSEEPVEDEADVAEVDAE